MPWKFDICSKFLSNLMLAAAGVNTSMSATALIIFASLDPILELTKTKYHSFICEHIFMHSLNLCMERLNMLLAVAIFEALKMVDVSLRILCITNTNTYFSIACHPNQNIKLDLLSNLSKFEYQKR